MSNFKKSFATMFCSNNDAHWYIIILGTRNCAKAVISVVAGDDLALTTCLLTLSPLHPQPLRTMRTSLQVSEDY